jgi:energy-coupling factor transporter ATP-binding protein EcfA2
VSESVPLDRISLRKSERGLLIGSTGSGKSTLADLLGSDWDRRYPTARRLIVDSKPRYRAQWTTRGVDASRRYRDWEYGQPVPGSVVVDEPGDLALVWKLGYRVAIVQGESRDVPRLVATMREFYRQASAKRPQLIMVDECLDFFHANGAAIGGDPVIAQTARAGRERGVSLLAGSQRTYQLPTTLLAEVTKLWAFALDAAKDAKRYQDFGCPLFPIPEENHVFRYWTKTDKRTVYGPYSLNLGKRP